MHKRSTKIIRRRVATQPELHSTTTALQARCALRGAKQQASRARFKHLKRAAGAAEWGIRKTRSVRGTKQSWYVVRKQTKLDKTLTIMRFVCKNKITRFKTMQNTKRELAEVNRENSAGRRKQCGIQAPPVCSYGEMFGESNLAWLPVRTISSKFLLRSKVLESATTSIDQSTHNATAHARALRRGTHKSGSRSSYSVTL